MEYTLQVDYAGAEAIAFAGDRYCWSAALRRLGYAHEGTHEIPEHEAWELAEAFQEDTIGGHAPFPLLYPGTAISNALLLFWDQIV